MSIIWDYQSGLGVIILWGFPVILEIESQGLTHARQALYNHATTSSFYILICFVSFHMQVNKIIGRNLMIQLG